MNSAHTPDLAPVFLLLLAACATVPGQRRGPSGDYKVITEEEIRAAGYTDAFRIVQSLRPQWLRSRGVTSLTQRETIKVYLDGSLLGGPDQLQQITAASISSVRFYDAIEATQRWGLDHGQGAIVVSTRRGATGATPP
jgi:hypothetical protein